MFICTAVNINANAEALQIIEPEIAVADFSELQANSVGGRSVMVIIAAKPDWYVSAVSTLGSVVYFLFDKAPWTGDFEIAIHSLAGVLIKTASGTLDKSGSGMSCVDVSDLNPGTYTFKISLKQGDKRIASGHIIVA